MACISSSWFCTREHCVLLISVWTDIAIGAGQVSGIYSRIGGTVPKGTERDVERVQIVGQLGIDSLAVARRRRWWYRRGGNSWALQGPETDARTAGSK